MAHMNFEPNKGNWKTSFGYFITALSTAGEPNKGNWKYSLCSMKKSCRVLRNPTKGIESPKSNLLMVPTPNEPNKGNWKSFKVYLFGTLWVRTQQRELKDYIEYWEAFRDAWLNPTKGIESLRFRSLLIVFPCEPNKGNWKVRNSLEIHFPLFHEPNKGNWKYTSSHPFHGWPSDEPNKGNWKLPFSKYSLIFSDITEPNKGNWKTMVAHCLYNSMSYRNPTKGIEREEDWGYSHGRSKGENPTKGIES